MKTYAKYKDSGVEWIGKIPEEWEVMRGKTKFRQRNEKGNKNEVLLAATQKMGMYPQSELDGVVKVSEEADLQKFKTVHINDFVISLRSFQGGFEISNFEGVCSPAYQVFFNTNEISHLYFKQLFKSFRFIEMINSLTVGIREGKNIQYDDFANTFLPIPPLNQQKQIASYLENKISKIDNLIADLAAQIEKLKEFRQTIIDEAVTKGLNKNAKMKDSGVEWIGEIPKEWEVKKLKWIGKARNGLTYKPEDICENGTLVLRATNIQNNKLLLEDNIYVNCEIPKEITLCENDLLICSANGSRDLVGKCVIIDKSVIGETYGSFMLVFRSKYNNFIEYILLSNALNFYKSLFVTTTINQLTKQHLYNIDIPFPPINDQQKIVAYLDQKTSKIDNLIADLITQIEKLKEYRQSIISEVVTGKVMVAEEKITKTENISQRKIVFKRLVLSAYILDNICDEPTAGRVKFEKLLYLSEHCAEIPIYGEYHREAAGPYDSKALYAIDEQLKKNKYFERKHRENDSRAYIRLENANKYKQYLSFNLSNSQKNIVDKIIKLLKTAKTIQCEIIATLYGAWNDFIIEGIQPSDDQIVNEVLTNWHKSKEKIERQRWLNALNWMREHEIIPVGYGIHTKRGQI